MNRLPVPASSSESAPSPGPISSTGSSGSVTSSAIRLATLGSDRKFWPRRLLGRTPRPRRAAGIPEEAVRLEAEKASRGGVGRVLERPRGDPEGQGELVAHQGQVGRLVALA